MSELCGRFLLMLDSILSENLTTLNENCRAKKIMYLGTEHHNSGMPTFMPMLAEEDLSTNLVGCIKYSGYREWNRVSAE